MAVLERELPKLSSIDDIADKVYAGERISPDDALRLFRHPNLAELADHVRNVMHPGRIVTYIIGRNVNYTNVCWVRCSFCNFYRIPGHEEGYILTRDQIFQKIQEMVDVGGIEVLMQGGLHPKLKIEWYEDLFRAIMDRYPTVILHALSPAEIIYIKKISKL